MTFPKYDTKPRKSTIHMFHHLGLAFVGLNRQAPDLYQIILVSQFVIFSFAALLLFPSSNFNDLCDRFLVPFLLQFSSFSWTHNDRISFSTHITTKKHTHKIYRMHDSFSAKHTLNPSFFASSILIRNMMRRVLFFPRYTFIAHEISWKEINRAGCIYMWILMTAVIKRFGAETH